MKKLVSILVLLALCVTMFAACTPDEATDAGLTRAGEYLFSLYKDNSAETAADYDVVAKVMIDGTAYTVTWTVDVASGVSIKESSKVGFYTVDVDGNRTEKVQLFVSPYKLSRLIPGGFIATDGILYNDSLKPLVNLGQEYNGYSVVGDSLKAWSIEENRYHYLSINSEGKLSTAYAPKNGTYLDATSYGDCTIYKSVNTYTWGTNSRAPYAFTVYNAQGQTIKTLYGDSCTIVSGMLKITNGSSTTYYILK